MRRLLRALLQASLILAAAAPDPADAGATWTALARVSVATGGAQGGHHASGGSISADGRYIAFVIESALVPEDTNNVADVYVHDLWNEVTVRVSVGADGAQPPFGGSGATISGDGRFVAFQSTSSNLVGMDTDGNGTCDVGCDTDFAGDVFVHDRDPDENGVFDEPGAIENRLVSVSSTGEHTTLNAGSPYLSADGRHVTFVTLGILQTGDANGEIDVYVHDLETGTTTLASVATDGAQGDDVSGTFPSNSTPVISGTGRWVLFSSLATTLVPGDMNSEDDIFLRDRDTDGDGVFDEPGGVSTTRVSVDSLGMEIDDPLLFRAPAITPDGRYVTWGSISPDVVPGDPNPTGADVFRLDRQMGALERIGLDPGGPACCGNGGVPQAMSDDGQYVLFSSHHNVTIVEGMQMSTRSVADVAVRVGPGTYEVLSDSPDPTTIAEPVRSTSAVAISADGQFLLVGTTDPDFLAGDTNGTIGDLVMMAQGAPVFPTPTTTPSPLVTATPSPSATATPTPPARLADPDAAKRAAECHKEIGKGAAKFADKKLKALQKCGGAVIKCIQTKEAGAKRDACLAKALGTCGKELDKIAAEEEKLTAAIAAKCAAAGAADLLDAAGLGYEALAAACLADFATPLATVADVAACVQRQHECRVEEIAEQELPRLKELMRVAGVSQAALDGLACLTDFGGDGEDVGDPGGLGKDVEKCLKEVAKAATKFALAIVKSHEKCLDAAFACVQRKAAEPGCQAKAESACAKEADKRAAAAGKLAAALAGKCGGVAFADVAAADAGDLGALAATCAGLGVASLTTLDDWATCVERRLACAAEDMVRFASGRAAEMAAFAAQQLASHFCGP